MYQDRFREWMSSPDIDDASKAELSSIRDEKEIEDRFYRELEFGTGGLRGIMGAGTNRMNIYIIRKVTCGLAGYLKNAYPEELDRGVAIACDSRSRSERFALETALVLCACGIPAKLFETPEPTPVLSFTVKELHCLAGVVITASHNPKEYNGYKVYDEYGCQLVPALADQVIRFIRAVNGLASVPSMPREEAVRSGRLRFIGSETVEKFLNAVEAQSVLKDREILNSLKIVYTPLHGTGNVPVRRILKRVGFQNVAVVKEQELPDGNFPTVRSPNPEERDALSLGVKLAEKLDADLVLGTDPDCDRVGIGIKHHGKFQLMTGSQVGALLIYFLASQKPGPRKPAGRGTVVKSIVTGELGAEIARDSGFEVLEVLTGFKYIGEQITRFELLKGREFLIGYEESYGYLIGTHARDKDAVVSSMLICEMAAYYKSRGKTLLDILEVLYEKYGYYLDQLDSFTLKGRDGQERIHRIMEKLRLEGGNGLPDAERLLDYSQGIGTLPKADVLKYVFADGSWAAVRPSGTEPKIKIYYSIRGKNEASAGRRLETVRGLLLEKTGLERSL